jgi:hypothetical protein
VHALPITLVAAFLLQGCNYISRANYESRLDRLDEDGDGAVRKVDCDDHDPDRSPDLPETPYDGIDNDCDDRDLVDVDGDGWPGVEREDWTGADHLWPTDMLGTTRDCRDDPLAYTDAAKVFPTADDPVYDGIDSNCDGMNDFDADGDGHLPPLAELDGTVVSVEEAYATWLDTWGYADDSQGFDDCDDHDAQIYGGHEDDPPYDGIDSDCDGGNDFDADGDGWMPDESVHADAYATFVDRFHGGAAPWDDSWGDCIDVEMTDIAAFPETVYPGAVETWYDSVDSDCGEDNDFDQDADAFIRSPDEAAYNAYVELWGYDHLLAAIGDCNDERPDINPVAIETLDDATDADCDGDDDATPFRFGGLDWTAPRQPGWAATGTHLLLAVTADHLSSVTEHRNPGMVLAFERDPAQNNAHFDELKFQGVTSQPTLGQALDIVATANSFWAAATTTDTQTTIRAQQFEYNGSGFDRTELDYSFFAGIAYDAHSVDLAVDSDGMLHAWACSGQVVHTMVADGTKALDEASQVTALPVTVTGCFIDTAEPGLSTGILATGDTAVSWDHDIDAMSLVVAADQPYSGLPYIDGKNTDGWRLISRTAGGMTLVTPDGRTQTVLDGELVMSASLAAVDEELHLFILRDDGSLALMRGPFGGVLTELPVPFADPDHPDLALSSVAIWADDAHIALSVAGFSLDGDAVGWALLAY